MPRDLDSLEQLIYLLTLPDKKSVEKYCRELIVAHQDLGQFLLGARMGAVSPYHYACHFDDRVPEHLVPNEADSGGLARAFLDRQARRAQKVARKFSQIFQDRRMFCAHLLYTPSKAHWHLFYFDQRDMTPYGNHWRNGAHIHYSRECYVNRSLDEMWADVCGSPPKVPASEHVRYVDARERRFIGPGDT